MEISVRLLLAEDEKEMSNAIVAVLKHRNYIVDAVYNGDDAYDWAIAGKYDGIILDIMMPGKNGIEVLEALRRRGITTPVLLLTAKAEIDDRVTGLDAGADDYLTKPFAMKELLARVRAMTRRNAAYEPDIPEFEGVKLSRESCMLEYEGKTVQLVNKEYQIMEMLMRNSGRLVSSEQFMEHAWGFETEANVNVIWVNISYIRRKLEKINAPVEIKAVRGLGYKLAAKGGADD